MNRYEGPLVGILGAIILHLVVAIVFMSFRLNSMVRENRAEFLIEFEKEPEPEKEEDKIILPKSVEELFANDEKYLNIARNLANKPVEDINVDNYIDKVKEELIKSGKLTEDNFIDEKKVKKEVQEAGESALAEEDRKEKIENTLRQMEANYQGPTRIYYKLEGRNHTRLPIPIYKCEGSGIISLSITVEQDGTVSDASLITADSTTSDGCLIETAIAAALRSRFNPSLSAPKKQTGTITYHFVAQ